MTLPRRCLNWALAFGLASAGAAQAGVVTLVTHGFFSGADGWVAAMADAVREYPRRTYEYGTAAPVYRLSFDSKGVFRAQKLSGPEPADNPSGDFLLLLDWNPYSGDLSDLGGFGDAASTKVVGPIVADHLTAADFIPGLGVPLTRLPLHLIGHSRGGSLVCEISKRLGEQNVVVDQLTLLDPHPANFDGFDDPISPVDGTAKQGVYDNVLFADAYYQTQGDFFTPEGTFVEGSFIRWLDPSGITAGGYGNPHSNVHLWYHGTLALLFPLTSDGEASIGAAARATWYAGVEAQGAHAGYLYSLRGGGNRREVFAPVNPSSGVPPHGLNGLWSEAIGIPAATNRSVFARGSAERANVIEFNLSGLPISPASAFALGAPLPVLVTNAGNGELRASLAYSFNGQGNVGLKVFADRDENTFNGWTGELEFSLPATGSLPQHVAFSLQPLAAGLAPGFYRLGVLVSSPSGIREYYAPERLFLEPNLALEWAAVPVGDDPGFNFTVHGRRSARYAIESSGDLSAWSQVVAGELSTPAPGEVVGSGSWNAISQPGQPVQYFRARYLE